MMKNVLVELFLPFLGTSLGAGCVFFLKRGMRPLVQRALTGFAAGVMVAASVWSLLVPAMEQAADMGQWAFFPAVAGFWLGILFLPILDRTIPHLHQNSGQPEGPHNMLKITVQVDGMMCEAHVNDAVRKAFPMKKATSSHSKGETVTLTENDIDETALRSAIRATGYEVKRVSKEPYEKKGLFHR